MPARVEGVSECPAPTDSAYQKTLMREDAVRSRGSIALRSVMGEDFTNWSPESVASDRSPRSCSRSPQKKSCSRSVSIPRGSTAQKKAKSINSRSESRGRKPDQEIEERSNDADWTLDTSASSVAEATGRAGSAGCSDNDDQQITKKRQASECSNRGRDKRFRGRSRRSLSRRRSPNARAVVPDAAATPAG